MADEITVAVATTDADGNEDVTVATTRRSKGLATIENALSQGNPVIAAEDAETVHIIVDNLDTEAATPDEKAAARITELETEVEGLTTNLKAREADMVNLNDLLAQANKALTDNGHEPVVNPVTTEGTTAQ